jgi:flagellar basal-body rod protein FlgF
MALQSQMDVIANNIANMSTPGYREQNMVFVEYMEKLKGNPDPLSMVLDYGQYQDTRPGPMKLTGNTLDFAVQGPGYFGIQIPDGTVQYTRAGNFQVNNDGTLVDGRGNPVAAAGGGTITIPKDAAAVYVADDGTLSTDQGQIGQLMISEFENLQTLEAQGNGLYKATAAALPPDNSVVKQGLLEGSNVNPVTEMTRMIEVSRAYQSTQRLLQAEHERQRTMIQRLTQAG